MSKKLLYFALCGFKLPAIGKGLETPYLTLLANASAKTVKIRTRLLYAIQGNAPVSSLSHSKLNVTLSKDDNTTFPQTSQICNFLRISATLRGAR